MDWLYIVGRFAAIGVSILLICWMDKVKSPIAKTFAWLGSILFLLLASGCGRYILLILLGVWYWIDHVHTWFFFVVLIGGVGLYILKLIDSSLITLAQEIERTNARIELLENSVRDKIYEITRRLPDED